MMQILKKTERGSKKNYLADTAPSVKTYDMDKLARERKAIATAYSGKQSYVLNDIIYENYGEFLDAYIDSFIKEYPPNFTRQLFPESVITTEDTIGWNRDWLKLTYSGSFDKFMFFKRQLSFEIVKWYYKEDITLLDSVKIQELEQEALQEIYKRLLK